MQEKVRSLDLDIHAETIGIANAESDGEVRSLGTIPNRMRGHFTRTVRCTRRLIFRRNIGLTSFRWNACAGLGRTKLVDPDVTPAFEPGSGNGFTSQQCIPDQLRVGLGVEHGLQEFSSTRQADTPASLSTSD